MLRVMVGLLATCIAAQAQTVVDDSGRNLAPKAIGAMLLSISVDLYDPLSSQFMGIGRPFRNADGSVTGRPEGKWLRDGTLCGFVNAKNLYGAYTGFQKFGFDFERLEFVLIGGDALPSDPLRQVRLRAPVGDPVIAGELLAACEPYLGK